LQGQTITVQDLGETLLHGGRSGGARLPCSRNTRDLGLTLQAALCIEPGQAEARDEQ
jgi:hypothetical protein